MVNSLNINATVGLFFEDWVEIREGETLEYEVSLYEDADLDKVRVSVRDTHVFRSGACDNQQRWFVSLWLRTSVDRLPSRETYKPRHFPPAR